LQFSIVSSALLTRSNALELQLHLNLYYQFLQHRWRYWH